MPKLSDLFGGAAPLDPALEESMTRVQGNISNLLARSGQGPSVGDLGRSLLLSAAYRGKVPYTQFLQDQQNQEYQLVGAQAGLVSKALEMRLKQAEAKAGSNPVAEFLAKDLGALAKENPIHANALAEAIEREPAWDMGRYIQLKAATAPQGIPKVVHIPFTDTQGVEQVQHEVYNPYGYQTNTTRTLKKSPETNINATFINDLNSNEAGKAAGAAIAKRYVQEARQALFPQGTEGPVNRTDLVTGAIADSGIPGAKSAMKLAGADGVETRRKTTYAARQGLRIVSGAVISQEEIETEYPLVIPGALDSSETVRNKLDLMEVWFDVTEKMMKGGMTADAAVKAAYDEITQKAPTSPNSTLPAEDEALFQKYNVQ
jgi:hypothetical protein